MRVFVNHEAAPSLVVDKLQGLSRDGGLAFKGPAIYANLVVRADAPSLPVAEVRDAVVPGLIMTWLAAPPTMGDRAHAPSATDIPTARTRSPIAAEPTGLLNLSREFGPAHAPALSVGWIKTMVEATAPMRRTPQIGFARQVWVFVNGHQIYAGDNPYYPSENRLSPDGRLAPDNATIPVDLRQGRNVIVLAVGNDWRSRSPTPKASSYGWAAYARFDRTEGLRM